MPRGRRGRAAPATQAWADVQAKCLWEDQERYELVRPVVLFRQPIKERAQETGLSAKTISRKVDRFTQLGLPGLLTSTARREDDARLLPAPIRDFILERKAEYPALTAFELATLCSVRFDRTTNYRTVARVLQRSTLPVGIARRSPRFTAFTDPEERRLAIIWLHVEGWIIKRIGEYLGVSPRTVHFTLRRWVVEGVRGLGDKSHARTPGMRAADLRTIATIRHLQENPELGEFRMHAALKQLGVEVSVRTCGRIMARNRKLYGLAQRIPTPKPKRPMPFAASRRHEWWSVDIRYIEHHQVPGIAGSIYIITMLDNYSRVMVASAPSPSQDLWAFLLVLFTAIHLHGCPEGLVSDGGGVFRANQALAIYERLGIHKAQIERRQAWQNYVQTHFNIMRRMADYHLAEATSWEEFCASHAKFVADYNWQEHVAHQDRDDGCHSPRDVLGWVHGRQVELPTLDEVFHTLHAKRHIDRAGYIQYRHWRLYGEEGLAGRQASVWLLRETLTIAFDEEPVAQYAVTHDTQRPDPTDTAAAHHRIPFASVEEARVFPSRYSSPQSPLWDLREIMWYKVMRVRPSARRQQGGMRPNFVQGSWLFAEETTVGAS